MASRKLPDPVGPLAPAAGDLVGHQVAVYLGGLEIGKPRHGLHRALKGRMTRHIPCQSTIDIDLSAITQRGGMLSTCLDHLVHSIVYDVRFSNECPAARMARSGVR